MELIDWLLKQAPIVVIMGVVIYWLAKRLVKEQDSKDELAKEVVKLATLWESKVTQSKMDEEKDRELRLDNIRILKQLNDKI